MTRPITDADVTAWLVDLRSGCGPEGDPPLVEVFERLVAERDALRFKNNLLKAVIKGYEELTEVPADARG